MGRKNGSKNVPFGKCRAIYDAVQLSVSHGAIARYYRMPRPTVSNIVKRWGARFGSGCSSRPRIGRPHKLGEANLRRLEIILVQKRFLPLLSITAIFNASGSVLVCARSVRRYAKLIGFRNRAAVRKPFIREANLVKRTEGL